MPKFKKHIAEIGETAIKRETAHYITELVLELTQLARGAELKSLSVLLELAYYEAYSTANKVEVPPTEVKRLKALEQAAMDLLKPVDRPRDDSGMRLQVVQHSLKIIK